MHASMVLCIAVFIALATPALASPVRCMTYEERSMSRWQTLCGDGSRAVSRWNTVLNRWETTVMPPPNKNGLADTPRKKHIPSDLVVTP